jgi:hypothetical protein
MWSPARGQDATGTRGPTIRTDVTPKPGAVSSACTSHRPQSAAGGGDALVTAAMALIHTRFGRRPKTVNTVTANSRSSISAALATTTALRPVLRPNRAP